ncbi:MAG TPA: toprim domain-containing protein, partial [Candidatus Paceibacterota bacterium]|nr:toprim domain-containing protein [Candidatus Paceibacterota bacterium]
MPKQLVIVESPTKAKTIARFLGGDYVIESSYGHIRDLPKSKLGIDVDHDFEPQYIIPRKNQSHVTTLKKLAKKSAGVVLATDEDREGEAIAWHLAQALDLGDPEKAKRIVFHEITESAIKQALASPRTIEMNLVNAQQARRVLDRLVGYKLSPFLWKKISRGLS